MNYTDEKDLIEAIKHGEESAFVFALNKYNKQLFAYTLSLCKDEDMTQDIIQNVFLKTWERRKKITIKKSVLNYLIKSAYNEFINQYNKKQSYSLLEQKYHNALDKVVNEDDDTSFKKAIERITHEIQNLPPKCREVFLLSRKEGLTNFEIANYLKISKKTVEAHITKAFRILRKKIGTKLNNVLFILFGARQITKS